MALAAFQEMLARLYTDREFRNAFFNDREKAFSGYDVDDNEKAQLLAVSREQVESFALSLVRKRMHEVRDQLVFIAARMGTEFNKLFFEYADGFIPSGTNKHSEDAVRFGEYIISHLKNNAGDEITIELAKFESNRIKRYLTKKKLIIEKYSYPVTSIIRSLNMDSPVDVKRKTEIHVFYRKNANENFTARRISF